MKIELPISKDYVSDWTVAHALREIFQNAIDREKEGMQYQFGYDFDSNLNKLAVYNKNTSLDPKTLLLGKTSKKDDSSKIGKFGEGYKLALLVLCRENINVEIITGNERWVPELGYSETFGEKVLMISIEKTNKEMQSLIFNINLPADRFKNYTNFNLHLLENYEHFQAEDGQILFEKNMAKKIFVEGLYVCTMREDFKYGYNFKAGMVDLDRDRNSVSPWDVSYECKRLLAEYAKTSDAPIKNMMLESRPDVSQISDALDKKTRENIGSAFAEDFIVKNGEYAYPVSSEEERKEVLERYHGISTVIVKSKVKDEIVRSDVFQQNKERWDTMPPKETPHQLVQNFVNDFETVFENKTVFTEDFEQRIFQESKNWMRKD